MSTAADTLISRANDALDRAKLGGRNRVELAFPPAKAKPEFVSVA
jgi:PleD family two-component response regulator